SRYSYMSQLLFSFYLHDALSISAEKFDLSEKDMINGLFTSAGIGQIIAKNATISGAEGGCQAECGVASAMAAAAIVEMLGGEARSEEHTSELQSRFELVCCLLLE